LGNFFLSHSLTYLLYNLKMGFLNTLISNDLFPSPNCKAGKYVQLICSSGENGRERDRIRIRLYQNILYTKYYSPFLYNYTSTNLKILIPAWCI